MRILRAVLALSLLSIGIAGCTSAPPPSPKPTTTPGAVSDAIELVGLWRVSDAEGESPDTWLRLDAGEGLLWRECGISTYSWEARDGAFIADLWSWSDCDQSQPPVAQWLDDASAYEKDGDGWALLDDKGAVTANLSRDGAPPVSPDQPNVFTEPVIEARTKLHFQRPVPLPATLTPGDISGRWLTEELPDNPRVYVEFTEERWTASDGCNGQGGRWMAVGSGLLVTGSGASTLVACENIPVAGMVMQTTSAGFDGETLVLVGAAGSELVRLVRDRTATTLSADDFLGRWLAADFPERPEVFVEFTTTGWTASDGCNRQRGTWAVGASGFIGEGSGDTTEMGCDNVPVASWILDATSATFDGDTLVLMGDRSELGRLVRE
ncbi:MAG: META domain-containing protein [Rhodoglobus sp.]